MSVLIIDDDPVHRMVIDRIARRAGLRVDCASSADEALAKLNANQYRWVTLDIYLGPENGKNLLGDIAAMRPQPKVLIISGSDQADRQTVIEAGAQQGMYVTEMPKPINLKKLQDLFLMPTEMGSLGSGRLRFGTS